MIITFLFFLNISFAKTPTSAVRHPHENYIDFLKDTTRAESPELETAVSARKDLHTQPWMNMPVNDVDPLMLQDLFEKIRDDRPLKDTRGNLRRLTWLYPDDGCYARSAMVQKKLETKPYRGFQQIFIFGNLTLATQNHPTGQVSWWYHVAPIIRTDFGFFVFDPAIQPTHPLPLEKWLNQFVTSRMDTRVSICSHSTYMPDSLCITSEPIEYSSAYREESETYLELEWQRIKHLGRNPEKDLGAEAPWSVFSFAITPLKSSNLRHEPQIRSFHD